MRNYVKEFRMSVLLSEKELSRRSGRSKHTIKRIEQGKYVPSLTLACRIAKALCRPLEQVFDLKSVGATSGY